MSLGRLRITFGPSSVRFVLNSRAETDTRLASRARTDTRLPDARPYPGDVRLVSLLPSATEIVYALGLGDDLVGVTFECDEPPAARAEKQVVVGGRDTSGMTPAEIQRYGPD